MTTIISALLVFLTTLFRSRATLQLEIVALRHQLTVYQRTALRPRIQPADRLFWSWVSRCWAGWRGALVFVQPGTVIAWQRKRFRDHWAKLSQEGRPGRPTVSKEIRALIRKLSAANPRWGSPRIVGELRKLGIDVAKSTVDKYRVRSKQPPSPTWKTFLKNHVTDEWHLIKGYHSCKQPNGHGSTRKNTECTLFFPCLPCASVAINHAWGLT